MRAFQKSEMFAKSEMPAEANISLFQMPTHNGHWIVFGKTPPIYTTKRSRGLYVWYIGMCLVSTLVARTLPGW
jgi:hypothetical protein